jgi:hypothetical protein
MYANVSAANAAVSTDIRKDKTLLTVVSIVRICANGWRRQAQLTSTDNAIAFVMPTGFTRILPYLVSIQNASHTLTTATFGMFTATGGGGFTIQTVGALHLRQISSTALFFH